VLETDRCSDVVSRVVIASEPTNGSVGSHTTISPHHLYCVFSARREGLQKFIANCKGARKPSELLEQFVCKRRLLLSLSAAGFLACPFFLRGIKANKSPKLKTSFLALLLQSSMTLGTEQFACLSRSPHRWKYCCHGYLSLCFHLRVGLSLIACNVSL